MEQNVTTAFEPLPTSGEAKSQQTIGSNTLLLTAAVCLALNAKTPHPRSPAHAVQHIRFETSSPDEPVVHWIQRFLNMSSGDYSIRWDRQRCDWATDGDQNIMGLTIAEDCVYWMQRQWDFATHEIDDRFQYTDFLSLDLHAKALKEIAYCNFGNFKLPASGEMVRRVWKSVYGGPVRMLDIWESSTNGMYHYAIREKGSPEFLARSSAPCYPHVLKKMVEDELVPLSASKPFFVKIKASSS